MLQHAICILGMLFIIFFFIFLALIGETILLDTYPPQLSGNLTIEAWKANFQLWALVCVVTAGAASFLWYGFAQKVFKTNNEKSYGKRGMWGFLFLLPAVAVIASVLLIEQTESSLWLAYLCFVANGLVPYYLATVLFSPTSVKYTPIGAKKIRFW